MLGSIAALSVDVVESGFGIKGDEATYVSMALSLAHDGDLAFERKDLVRFWSVYGRGPEGIFLKTGKTLDVRADSRFPYLRLVKGPDDRSDRLYHGKAFAYSVVAAPLVWIAGLNGLLLLNYWLFCASCLAAFVFLAARSSRPVAALWATGFLAATVVPIYVVWLTPEIFNLALVIGAYFFCLYREVAPAGDAGRWWGRWLHGPRADVVAALLLGVAIYSKPLNAPLIAPLVLVRWSGRRWMSGVTLGLLCAGVAAGAFALNAAITGEFNYQGGERKSFYGRFPFDTPTAGFGERGISYATDAIPAKVTLGADVFLERLADNVRYFVIGRYAGQVPYYFPGVLAVVLMLVGWRDLRAWQVASALGVAGSVLVMLIWLPYTWAGGGGGPGNRYFVSVYPVLLFTLPAALPRWSAAAAWGGVLFLSSALVQPFVTAAHPWRHAEHGLVRQLPVELTMLNDLPILLDPRRGRVPFGSPPDMYLYFLDDNSWRDGTRLWTRGGATAQFVARTVGPVTALRLTLISPVENSVRVSVGSRSQTQALRAGESITLTLASHGKYTRDSRGHLVSIHAARGFVPRLVEPESQDGRYLGVQVELAAVRPQ